MVPLGAVNVVCGGMDEQVEKEFHWRLEKLPKLFSKAVVDDFYDSPAFLFSGRCWYLRLFPNGESTQHSQSHIGLYLMLRKSGQPMKIHFTLGIIKEKDGAEQWASCTAVFKKKKKRRGRAKAFRRSELFARKDELMPSGVLTIKATLTAVMKDTTDVSIPRRGDHIAEDHGNVEHELAEKTGTARVLFDIGKLFLTGEFSDVIIRVRGVEFQVHKAILSVRSPELCSVIQHDTCEGTLGVLTIEDCHPEIFKDMLYFIYFGTLRQLTAENAPDLYVLANKFLMAELKDECLKCIRNTLCFSTFTDAITLTLEHGETQLLSQCLEVFAQSMEEILRTNKWLKFLQEHTVWGNELLIRALDIRRGENKVKCANMWPSL